MKIELQRVAPAEIEQRSMEIITAEMGQTDFSQQQLPIVKRCIHTSADFDYVKNLKFTPNAVEAGLASGARVFVVPGLLEIPQELLSRCTVLSSLWDLPSLL